MTCRILSFAMMVCLASLSATAFAQGESNSPPFPENGTVFFTGTGSYTRKTVFSPSEAQTLMSAGAKPVAAGMLLIMHNGRFYMLEDRKMHDGKMLSDELGLRTAAGR